MKWKEKLEPYLDHKQRASVANVFSKLESLERRCEVGPRPEKRKYRNQKDADQAAIKKAELKGEQFSSYHCSFCGGWHIGHS